MWAEQEANLLREKTGVTVRELIDNVCTSPQACHYLFGVLRKKRSF